MRMRMRRSSIQHDSDADAHTHTPGPRTAVPPHVASCAVVRAHARRGRARAAAAPRTISLPAAATVNYVAQRLRAVKKNYHTGFGFLILK